MKKMSSLLMFVFFIQSSLYSTVQQSDKIVYQGQECILEVDWSYPSPFQVYFMKNKEEKFPFKPLHTANYRGHIATWEITTNKFFLKELETEKFPNATLSSGRKEKVSLKSAFPGRTISNGRIHANWFSGYILIKADPYIEWHDSPYSKEKFSISNHRKFIIVHIRDGIVLSETPFLGHEYWKFTKEYFNHQVNKSKKFELIKRYHNYLESF